MKVLGGLAHESSGRGRCMRWKPSEEGRKCTWSERFLWWGVLGAGTQVSSLYFFWLSPFCWWAIARFFPVQTFRLWGQCGGGEGLRGILLVGFYSSSPSELPSKCLMILHCWAFFLFFFFWDWLIRALGFWKMSRHRKLFQASEPVCQASPPPSTLACP